ncbi:unnamed protein product [Bursaphelenchus xylophilus]|uniref:(pine wood nematode) hypothetical protein n=1 Tax=Bursaphelenchus xylophilus TaxID=6326 RepID=A0A811KWI7_BURXY|nr:unnamed protein product [Bursaphelenchus xylophilus]CAG9104591.1 unnamed protein product [Bursaphelenchus xylophilus]
MNLAVYPVQTESNIMSTAEQLAEEFERGEKDVGTGSVGKRPKPEQSEHKHAHPEGDSRKIVANAMNGEEKRKEHNKKV